MSLSGAAFGLIDVPASLRCCVTLTPLVRYHYAFLCMALTTDLHLYQGSYHRFSWYSAFCHIAGACGLAPTACFWTDRSATGERICRCCHYACSDPVVVCQLHRLVEDANEGHWTLTTASTCWSSASPLLWCRWYKVLDKNVMPNNSRSTSAVLIKTAADQIIWAPIMTVVFFAVLKSLEGHPELIWPTVQVCYKFL